jgi:hypothetical protein
MQIYLFEIISEKKSFVIPYRLLLLFGLSTWKHYVALKTRENTTEGIS